MFFKKVFVITAICILIIVAGCSPARKPILPPTTPGNEQRPSPIPTPRNMESQIYVDDFITSAVLAMPGIQQANAIVVGNVALVGVHFNDNVKIDRQKAVRKEISDKVLALNGIKDALVTSDPQSIKRIQKVSNQMRDGRSTRESWDDINQLMGSLVAK